MGQAPHHRSLTAEETAAIARIKAAEAELLAAIGGALGSHTVEVSSARARSAAVARTHAESAAMWAVRAVTG